MKIETKSLNETQDFAREFVEKILARPKNAGATVVALYGDLGSEKTSFVQGAAKAFSIKETVTSPTFVIEKIYKLARKKFSHIIHIDCYRIENSKEIKLLGWDDKLADPKNLIFIEWAERVENILPTDTVKLYFEFLNENKRKIEIKGVKHENFR